MPAYARSERGGPKRDVTISLSRMLGHATIGGTADTYGRWLPANRKGALDVLDDGPGATSALLTEQLAEQATDFTSGQGRD